jgi:DEAD/DEAH box helicase domain-containing protein
MKSALTVHQELLGNYQEYLSRQFKSALEPVTTGRNRLYDTKGVTFQPPFLEFLFNYKGSGKNFAYEASADELSGYFGNLEAADRFRQLASKGLVPYELYQHQWEMLKKVLLEDRHAIITTGTGSGKTESFMLPLMAYLVRQTLGFGRPDYRTTDKHDVFQDSLFTQQDNGIFIRGFSARRPWMRHGEKRQAAVKAIMLFPMNALVEDQLKRIRNAFSNPDVLDIQDRQFEGNRIFYGKYNGMTAGTGKLAEDEDYKRVQNYYKEVAKNEYAVINYANSEGERLYGRKRYTEALDYFGREVTEDGSRLTGEMLNRFDMQQTPPDILITNFSMLNIMLTRSLEQGIWDKTAEWLQDEGSVFHIVLDEMHLYRGSAGTEIAYSISALLQRLGIADKPGKVRFLASSASLDMENDGVRVKEFIGSFFNLSSDQVPNRFHLEKGENDFPVVDQEGGLDTAQVKRMLIQLNEGQTPTDEELQLIARSRVIVQMCDWYRDQNGSNNRPCSLEAFGEKLFQVFDVQYQADDIINLSKANPEKTDSFKLTNGFFLFREVLAKRKEELAKQKEERRDLDDNNLPRIRLHLMYNNFEGLWGSISVGANNGLTVNATYNFPKKIDADRNKVYQLFYCEKCETSFVGGYKNSEDKWQIPNDARPGNETYYSIKLSPSETSLKTDSKSVISTDTNQLKYVNYCIFWPEKQLNGNIYRQHIPETSPRDRIRELELLSGGMSGTMAHGYWVRAFFNPVNGEVRVPINRNVACPCDFILGRVYISLTNDAGDDVYTPAEGTFTRSFARNFLSGQSVSRESALSQCCPCCATKKFFTPIVRGYRTGFNKTNQLFASGLFKSMKNYNSMQHGKLPKLVSFSDSRDEAAQVSAGVEDQHFNELITNYILSKLAGRNFDREEKENLIYGLSSENIIAQIRVGIGTVINKFDLMIDQEWSDGQVMRQLLYLSNTLGIPDDDFNDLQNLFQTYRERTRPRTSFSPNELFGNFVYGSPFSGLYEHLISMGVDVRGVYNVKPQLNFIDGQPDLKWYEPIISQGGLFSFNGDNVQIQNRYQYYPKFLKSYLLRMMFGRTQYSIESMGLGRLEHQFQGIGDLNAQQNDSFFYGLVKLMGWRGKFRPRITNIKRRLFDDEIIIARNNLPEYVQNYITKFNLIKGTNINNEEVLDLFNGNRVFLDFEAGNAPVKIGKVSLEDNFIGCPQCSEVYSLLTSHCMNCGKEFRNVGDYNIIQVGEIRSRSYAGSHIANLRDIHRLHCEELSGQTDDPFERQRNFLGLIKDENIQKLAQEIDLLAVTTTLEVGVDIGSLQGMLMANMPPQRFNYQQRVGRVGRRGQAFSFAVTLCRSKSHDAHYFQHPEEITGNPSPTPFLNVTQNEILERVLNKYFLAYFFRGFRDYLNAQGYNIEENLSDRNINGEFGKVQNMLPYDADQNPTSYLGYLPVFKAEKQQELQEAYDSLVQSLRRAGSQFNKNFAEYEEGLFDRILQIIAVSPKESSIGEVLMENGLLPSYGMPTKVALFYNNYPRPDFNNIRDNTPDSMDRTIDVAIFDYSPGTVKLKDKVEYTVKAIVPRVIRRRTPNNNFIWEADGLEIRSDRVVYECRYENCKWFDLEPTNQDNYYPPKQCPKCNQPDSLQKIDTIAIEPRNFSGIKTDSDQNPVDRRDVSSNNRLAISRLGNINWGNPELEFGNICLSYKIPEAGEYIYKINKGAAGSIPLTSGDVIWGNWGNVRGLVMPQDVAQNPCQYWLFTRKNTDTLSFIVKYFQSQKFDFSPGNNENKSNSLKAVFLSAATILQRCFADILDIDPREIEFANPEITTVNTPSGFSQTFQVTFYDSHDNGSGYVKRIKERMSAEATDLHDFISTSRYYESIVSDDHRSGCRSGSCYKCIRTYENSQLHGLLDWRLGLDLIRFMGDRNYIIDFREFADYVLSTLSNAGYAVQVVTDQDGNSAVSVTLDGTPKYIVTHPIARFDEVKFRADNPDYADVEVMNLYELMLIS